MGVSGPAVRSAAGDVRAHDRSAEELWRLTTALPKRCRMMSLSNNPGIGAVRSWQASGAGLPMHPARCPSEQHAVMHEADDLDHAIPPQAVDNDVPGASYAQLFRDQATPQ